jgi:hypothetical protein
MIQKPETKSRALNLEVEQLEVACNPGCNTSTTSRLCTCSVGITTTASLFTARTIS